MTDIRSMLRSERVSRRIDHPNALYSATGTLECSVCRIPLKSDIEVWNRHLKSTQHAMRAERLRISQRAPPPKVESSQQIPNLGSKKRKASNDDDEDAPRKRTKPAVGLPGGYLDEIIESNNQTIERSSANDRLPEASPPPPQPKPAIDEAEWAAFERDNAIPPPLETSSAPIDLMANATITAAPVSAADLAAQQKEEERTTGRERREIEIEAEKEEATRQLEEEFEEMEGLEERVRRLREKREELRRKASEGRQAERSGDAIVGLHEVSADVAEHQIDEGGTSSESEAGSFDEWSFGR